MMSVFKKKIILPLLIGCCFWLSLSSMLQYANAFDGITTTGPSRYSQESWTVTMGGTKNDEGKVLVCDNSTGDVFWGITTKSADDITYGIISRVNRTGSMLWQRDCFGYFNLSYSVPLDLLVSGDGLILYALIIYNNDTYYGDRFAIFELNATSGEIFRAVSILESKIYHYAKMAWVSETKFLIAYAQAGYISGSEGYLVQYNILTHSPLVPVKISLSGGLVWPVSLEGKGIDNKTILTMYSSTEIYTATNTSLFVVNCASDTPVISSETKINLNGNYNLIPVNSMTQGGHVYLTCYKDTNLYLISLDTNFGVEFYTPLTPGVSSWNKMIVDSEGQLFLIGYGTLSFGTDSYSENQGYMLQFNLNSQKNGFTSGAIFKFGELSTSDAFFDLVLSSKNELFIAGAGFSYGVAPYSDSDAYLIKWNTGVYPIQEFIPIPPMDWQPIIMIVMIVGVSIALIALSYFSMRKSGREKNEI